MAKKITKPVLSSESDAEVKTKRVTTKPAKGIPNPVDPENKTPKTET